MDTTKARGRPRRARRRATIVNDVSALPLRSGMAALVAGAGAGCCLVHMRGEPRTMHQDPHYGDVVSEVKAFLEERLAFAIAQGIPEDRVWPTPDRLRQDLDHNLELLRRLDEIVAVGRPVVVGVSRKSFMGELAGGREADDRLPGGIAANHMALRRRGLGVPRARRACGTPRPRAPAP